MELIGMEVVSVMNAMYRIDNVCYRCTNSKSYSSILISFLYLQSQIYNVNSFAYFTVFERITPYETAEN